MLAADGADGKRGNCRSGRIWRDGQNQFRRMCGIMPMTLVQIDPRVASFAELHIFTCFACGDVRAIEREKLPLCSSRCMAAPKPLGNAPSATSGGRNSRNEV